MRSWYDREPFFVSASIRMAVPNVTHRPLNDAVIRRAMAYAINYRDVRELAVSGYSEPLRPGLILPFGLEGKYFSEEDAKEYGAYYDPAKITVPALLVQAEWDRDLPPYMAQTLFPLLVSSPGKRYVMLPEGTHTIIMEKNRRMLFEAVQAFLDEAGRS